MAALLAAHPPMRLYRALTQLEAEWTSAGVTRRLDPGLVLAEAWHPMRLARCREHLAAGRRAPPIHVVGYRLSPRAVLYGVSDGLHRAVAHREAGIRVEARIGGTYQLDPARHVAWRDHLWVREGERLRQITDIDDDLSPVLAALGVELRAGPGRPEEEG